MLRLRPYKPCDAEKIVSWIKDECTFRKWSSDRFDAWPLTAEALNDKYINHNGDCEEPDNFYPMTAFDETGIVGHLILRFVGEGQKVLRFGFVIVDDSKRGKGYGKQMLLLAEKFAFDVLQAEQITLGVFKNNPGAYNCYKAAGFVENPEGTEHSYNFHGEEWKCIEMKLNKKKDVF